MLDPSRHRLFSTVATTLALLVCACANNPPHDENLPPEMLWAWRRTEALTFLDPKRTGVAAWMATVQLEGDEFRVEHREWPLTVVKGSHLALVVRMEHSKNSPAGLTPELRQELVSTLTDLSIDLGWPELQLDFDARSSEQSDYADLITELRRSLPRTRLSVTALLSWCWDTDFLEKLAVDEVVPMVYRLGPDAGQYRQRLERGETFDAASCDRAFGVSSDEPIPNFEHQGRVYLFNHESWTADGYDLQVARVAEALRDN